MNKYFISFATPKGNLGCVCTQAPDGARALERVTQLGLNPGGEAAVIPINEDEPAAKKFGYDKLISVSDMRKLGYTSRYEGKGWSKKEVETFNANVETRVCQRCNDELAMLAAAS